MSRGVNKAIILGNVGREPEIRYTQSGSAVANFSVAVNERRKINGEWQDHCEWISCVAWGKTAEACGNYLKKGSQVHVIGRIQTRKWDDKNGNTRYTTEIVADDVILLGGTKEKQQNQQGQDRQYDDPNNLGYDPNNDVPF